MAKATTIHIRTLILSITITVLFGYAVQKTLTSYAAFELATTRLTIAHDQIKQAKAQRARVTRYNEAMDVFANFTSQVKLFGLGPDRWQPYDVSLSRSLSFSDTGNILDQLSHDKTYYFIPSRLFIGTGSYTQDPRLALETAGDDTVAQPVEQASDDASESGGDVAFSVQGRFMVRDSQ